MRLTSGARERLRRDAAGWFARLQGAASEQDRAAFKRWYEADPAHAEAYERVRARYNSAGLLAQTEVGRNRSLKERTLRPAWSGKYAMAAGVAALLVISGAVLLGRPEALMPSAEAQALFFATSIGEIREVPLPDGSQMTLDTRTSVRVEMGRDLRHVTLQEGRARFAVSAEDDRPFVVEAGESRVTGRDTTFDVELRDGEALVQPIEGTVSVEATSRRAETAPVRLAPGQAVLVSSGGARMQPRQTGRAEALWPTGMIEFDNTPLATAIAEANRYSRGRVSLADPALSRLRVSGTFRAGDLQGLARSLEAAFGLRLEHAAGQQLILHSEPAARAADP